MQQTKKAATAKVANKLIVVPKTYGEGMIRLLLNEVLSQIPPMEADRLVAGYDQGLCILIAMARSRQERSPRFDPRFKMVFHAGLETEVRMMDVEVIVRPRHP